MLISSHNTSQSGDVAAPLCLIANNIIDTTEYDLSTLLTHQNNLPVNDLYRYFTNIILFGGNDQLAYACKA